MKKIDESVLAILSRVTIEGNNIKLTCGQLDRKMYLAVNEILEIMGGKWNRKEKVHIFQEDPTEKLESVLLTGEILSPKKYGYFPTPPLVILEILKRAALQSGMTVLEPSAGQGAIAEAAAIITGKKKVDCFELLPDNCAVLQAKGFLVRQCDFLTVEPNSIYDRVLMNPPFERQQDIEHVSHAFKFLKPGGRLVSIMASGVTYRENRKTVEFRNMIVEHNGSIELLPHDSFKISGTGINTCIVTINN